MRTTQWNPIAILLAALLAGGLAACGSDNASSAGVSESPNLGESVEQAITAAAGGEVALKDAGVKLSIPAGALGSDETITAEVVSKAALPDAKNLAGNVIEFLPKGLTFEKPVTLSIDLGAATIPKDADVSIAWLDEDKKEWVELNGSALKDGVVTAETTHFTIFAIRIVVKADGTVVQEGGQCSADFNPCGGDIEGVWNIVAGCANVPLALGQQVAASCAGATFEFGLDITGDITFQGGKISGSMTIDSEMTMLMPKACNGGMCDMADPEKPEEVITDKGDTCENKTVEHKVEELDSTYELAGNDITITDTHDVSDAGTPNMPSMAGYCVTGNTLVVRTTEENGVIVQWTATRK